MKFTGNPRGVQVGIIALVILTGWVSCKAKDAAAAEPVFFAGAGQTYSSTIPVASGLRFGLEQGPWQASLVTHGESIVHRPEASYRLEPNIGVCGTWHVARGRFSIGWGACLWEHGDWSVGDAGDVVYDPAAGVLELVDDGVQLTAAIVARRTFGKRERALLEAFHASNGGSTHYNRGRNGIYAGFRF